MRGAAMLRQILECSVDLAARGLFLCSPTVWSGSGTDELHRHERRWLWPVLLSRGSAINIALV